MSVHTPNELRVMTMGVHENNGAWYVIEHKIVNIQSGEEISFEKTDWASWCYSGDNLYAKEGKIWRLGFDRAELQTVEQSRLLIDLRDQVFIPREAPECARNWSREYQLPNI